jgi:amino acid transporter
MATKSKTSSSKPLHHTLREFLFSLNYWGSWSRSLLFFVIVTLMLALSLAGVTDQISSSSQHLWYTTLGVTSSLVYAAFFFFYDAAYVTIVRRSPLPYHIDRLALFTAEAIAVVVIFSLWFVYSGNVSTSSVYIATFAAALVLPLRAVAGIVGRKG